MRIGINGWFLRFPGTGIGQYLVNLLDNINIIDNQNEYILFIDEKAKDIKLSEKFTKIILEHPVKFLHKDLKKTVWEQIVLPRNVKKYDIDLLHIPYFAPISKKLCKTVVTILDIAPLVFPLRILGKNGFYDRYYSKIVTPFLKKVDYIITISEYSKKEIIKYLNIDESRIKVINLAVGDEFKVIEDKDSVISFLKKYQIEPGYIFYLGDGGYRKNVMALVKSYISLNKELKNKYKLVIAGNAANSKEVKEIAEGENENIKLVGMVDSQDRPFFYNGAFLFVFPTIYEGFGLPPLEAMKCGVPVISSIYTSIPEVVGDAGILVPTNDYLSIKKAMEDIIGDNTLRKTLIEKGLIQSQKFSLKKSSEETLNLYKDIYSN
jgi:glycosyltransferase involved in cell wall biosynthesis